MIKECGECGSPKEHKLRSTGKPRPWCIDCERMLNKARRDNKKAPEPTKTCPKCGKSGEIKAWFGYRTMLSGKEIPQSYCYPCRTRSFQK